jgi:hypothetical protein
MNGSDPPLTDTIDSLRRVIAEQEATIVAHEAAIIVKDSEIERLQHNQMTASSVTLAQAAALQAQRTNMLDRKCTQFNEALLRAMTLIDELMRENGRLCSTAAEPPSVKLFAAKASFDRAMKKLLGEDEKQPG